MMEVLYKAFSNMTAGWLYYMQTKAPCGYHASPLCGKMIPGGSGLGGFKTFYWNCFQKDLHSLQPGALISIRINVQGFENVMRVNNRIIFRSYRYNSFKTFDDLLFLDWAQLLIPLAALATTPF